MEDRKVWSAFLLLALTWGTSFLFIKVALRTLQPITLVALRLLVGWLGLMVIARWQGLTLPRERRLWKHLALMGLLNTAVPFVLITWAESGPKGVDSAVASVLNSTVPLFSLVIAGWILRAEPTTAGRVVGLLVGFAGVLLLFSRNLTGEWGGLAPQLAVVAAALCYALSSSYARRYLVGVKPVVVSAGQLLVATGVAWLAAFLGEDFAQQSLTVASAGAILWLGLLGSCLAYILYFYILQQWGATRTTLVTYILPVVGVSAGALFLGEQVDWRLVVGGLLILSGVGAVNWRPRRVPLSEPVKAEIGD
ncbi:MAG: EamA family transporter [Chloroflexi bacterium]|nr:EamA family transporter [Chloroflexota bacterium]MCI0580999.1 EamA family transporter [Chloroflexota bacterium]MCI0646338.1 EamA family transporter [Chloroflexota bacterium]MCI0726964.1 EamA family transporter [Chloroflexota bacterium]